MSNGETVETGVEQLAVAGEYGVVVDVREPGEDVRGHIGPRDLRIGQQAWAMTDLLCSAGFDARSVADGTEAWIRSGRPLEKGLR